jgi:sulfite exporter TauE/SafE
MVAGLLGTGLQAALGGLSVASAGLAVAAGLVLAALGVRGLLPRCQGRVGSPGPLGSIYARLVPLARACVAARRRDEAYLLGVLNGLLPCPVITPLLLVALVSGSAVAGGALLLALGLGTLPGMLAAGQVGGQTLGWLARQREAAGEGSAWGRVLNRAPGLAILALGLLTVARPFLQASFAGHVH